MYNNIPSLWSEGSFKAKPPFNTVVKEQTYYTAEAIRSIPEMQSRKFDIYANVFAPVGVKQEDYPTVLERAIADKAAIVTLTSRGNPNIYVLSTYLESFPVVDGVVYEHLALIVNIGAVPPSLKEKINSAIQHINDYVSSTIGVSANTTVGVVPTRTYVSKETADAWEIARQNKISGESSDLVKLTKVTADLEKANKYILELEAALKAK